MTEPAVQTWRHSRKGLITGTIVSRSGEWVDIRLASDHRLSYMADANRGRVDGEGEVLRVRESHLREVEAAE